MANSTSLENLKPFKKGDDSRRNVNGRPKTLPDLKEALIEALGDNENGVAGLEKVIRALTARALKGDVRASKLILERAYGKSKPQMDITGKNGAALQVSVFKIGDKEFEL